jgi:7,8-dihydro-6-hydroxymethylpterin-pyrophosphokinase
MAERAFVLVPLSEVAPTDLRLPGIGLLSDLLARVGAADVRRLEPAQARG